MNTTTTPTNGSSPQPQELPQHRLKRVEAAALDYQALMQERDDLDLRLHETQKKNGELSIQIDALKSMVNMIESAAKSLELQARDRIENAIRMRDEYADRALTLEATLANAYRVLHDVVAGKVEHDAAS